MKKSGCIFCEYKNKDVIIENEYAVATYTIDSIKKGHVVVFVKEHIESFSKLNFKQVDSVMNLMLKISKSLEKLIDDIEKVYIVSVNDNIKHFHFHLFPKLKNDISLGDFIMLDGGWKDRVLYQSSETEVQEFIKKIKENL